MANNNNNHNKKRNRLDSAAAHEITEQIFGDMPVQTDAKVDMLNSTAVKIMNLHMAVMSLLANTMWKDDGGLGSGYKFHHGLLCVDVDDWRFRLSLEDKGDASNTAFMDDLPEPLKAKVEKLWSAICEALAPLWNNNADNYFVTRRGFVFNSGNMSIKVDGKPSIMRLIPYPPTPAREETKKQKK